MRNFLRTIAVLAYVVMTVAAAPGQISAAAWLDEPKPASWNKPSFPIPTAPWIQGNEDARCKDLARPPQSEEDNRVRDRGWDLVGAYQGGWRILMIRGTAGYDGMCRPRQYQDFVFVHGVFAGTLSPKAMDSRADGALDRVLLESDSRLSAEYRRYAPADPLCCPSRITRVTFEIGKDTPFVRPLSATTTAAAQSDNESATVDEADGIGGTRWQLVKFESGNGTTLIPDDESKYTVNFENDGHVAVRLNCNRGSGTWKSTEKNELEFGPLALTRAMCLNMTLHDRIAEDWTALRSYTIKDDHLFLSPAADGGTYEFAPAAAEKP
ncbi:MAG TPA: LppP/LprE family lipoprotein [Candidatus Binatia bacterium]|jgi:heat shock protein HslJ